MKRYSTPFPQRKIWIDLEIYATSSTEWWIYQSWKLIEKNLSNLIYIAFLSLISLVLFLVSLNAYNHCDWRISLRYKNKFVSSFEIITMARQLLESKNDKGVSPRNGRHRVWLICFDESGNLHVYGRNWG